MDRSFRLLVVFEKVFKVKFSRELGEIMAETRCDYSDLMRVVVEFGERYGFGRGCGHVFKVRDLALRIFDELKRLGLHDMGSGEKFWLEAAAILHDIGVPIDEKCHNWASRDLILSSRELKEVLDYLDLRAVAWIAFFHRGKLDPFKFQDEKWREVFESEYGENVVKLAAVLRIADALDRSLRQVVENVELERKDNVLLIKVYSEENATIEISRACEKAQLFERVFNIKLEVSQ